LAFTENI